MLPEQTLRAFRVPFLFIVATVITRWPFRTHYLFMWDSANFALALDNYDVTQHRPHPPGYFFFVAVGRVLLPLTKDANAALVTEALIFSALAVVALYYLGRTMQGETVGRWSALLLFGSVSFWSFGCLALAYSSLAFFSTVAALLAYRVVFLKEDRLLLLAGVYGLGGGFRPDLMLFLGPLFLVAWLRSTPGRRVQAVAVASLAGAAWLVPTMVLSGGPEAYLNVLAAYSDSDVLDRYSVLRRGLPGLVNNTGDTLAFTFYALYGFVLLAPGALLGWARIVSGVRKGIVPQREMWKAGFLALWALPALLFYVVIHIGYAGYVFTFLPAMLVGLAQGWSYVPLPSAAWLDRRRVLWAGIVSVLALNAGIFLFHPRLLTAPGLRGSDAAIAARLQLALAFDADRTVLLSYDSFKTLQYSLPAYRFNHWVDIAVPEEPGFPLPEQADMLLLLDSSVVAAAKAMPGDIVNLANGEVAKRVPLPQAHGPRFLDHTDGTLRLSITEAR